MATAGVAWNFCRKFTKTTGAATGSPVLSKKIPRPLIGEMIEPPNVGARREGRGLELLPVPVLLSGPSAVSDAYISVFVNRHAYSLKRASCVRYAYGTD